VTILEGIAVKKDVSQDNVPINPGKEMYANPMISWEEA